MMASLIEDIGTILIVSPVPISLPSRSMADVVTVKPHIPGNKKELS
jgi:hypothetical protein